MFLMINFLQIKLHSLLALEVFQVIMNEDMPHLGDNPFLDAVNIILIEEVPPDYSRQGKNPGVARSGRSIFFHRLLRIKYRSFKNIPVTALV